MTELEKMEQAKPRSQTIGEFLEWLREKGVVLSEYHQHSEEECGSVRWPECGIHSAQPVTYHYSIEQLLADYFEIDLNKVEEEKQAILDQLRNPPLTFTCPQCGASHDRGYFPPGAVGTYRCLGCGYQGPSEVMG